MRIRADGLSPMASVPAGEAEEIPTVIYNAPEDEAVVSDVPVYTDDVPVQWEGSGPAEEETPQVPAAGKRRNFASALAAVFVALTVLSAAACGAAYLAGYRVDLLAEGGKILACSLGSAGSSPEGADGLGQWDDSYTEEHGPFRVTRIRRAGNYFVTADGSTYTFEASRDGITVEELLDRAGIGLGPDDELSLDAEYMMKDGEEVIVRRVRYDEYTEIQTVPYKGVKKQSPLIRNGNTLNIYVYDPYNGRREVTYVDRYVDGELEWHAIKEEKTLKKAMDYITLVGADVPMSEINGALYTDVQIIDNVPTSYEKMYSGNCTAYSYKEGVWGAAGMYLYQGFVATDPDVIPYGSLLWITSPDGSFVYGWAIAADGCRAAMEGRVLVDCFFQTYRESCLFGKHWMNVYVVGHVTQEQMAQYKANDMFHRIPEE